MKTLTLLFALLALVGCGDETEHQNVVTERHEYLIEGDATWTLHETYFEFGPRELVGQSYLATIQMPEPLGEWAEGQGKCKNVIHTFRDEIRVIDLEVTNYPPSLPYLLNANDYYEYENQIKDSSSQYPLKTPLEKNPFSGGLIRVNHVEMAPGPLDFGIAFFGAVDPPQEWVGRWTAMLSFVVKCER